MLPADMIQKTDSRGNLQYYVQTPSGKRYLLGKLFNAGGVGQVYLAYRKNDKNTLDKYVIKEYPKPSTPSIKKQQRNIRKNLNTLIQHPALDENNQPLASMVPPLEVIDFPQTGTFGYVMNYVDLSDYVSVGKMLRKYPENIDVVCRMAKNISYFFMRLASVYGFCYKDINEGNIYLNMKTGDVRIIDNDNVGDPSIKTISGTGYYMAPEVQLGKDPDRLTDRFSLAAYLLRMFTGARPYEGAWAIDYARQHDQNVYDAAPVIFGSHAVFVFDPVDTSNTIRKYPFSLGLTREQEKEKLSWKARCDMWDHLPKELQAAFIATFSEGVKPENVNRRTTALKWYNLFDKLEKSIIQCPHPTCRKRTFGTVENCFYCGKPIPQTVCKSCGQKTPIAEKMCVHCGNNPKKAPTKTVSCPHCKAQNDVKARVCVNCKKYITVTCRCGTSNSGAAKLCSKCGTALFKTCPSCGETVPMTENRCPQCKKDFPKSNARCPSCGRQIFPGELKCGYCGASTSGSQPSVHKLKLDVVILSAGARQKNVIEHIFPSGVIYRADHLDRNQSPRPLFKLKYNPSQNIYALQNVSGNPIWYKDAQGVVNSVKDGVPVILAPGMQFQFGGGLALKIESMRW